MVMPKGKIMIWEHLAIIERLSNSGLIKSYRTIDSNYPFVKAKIELSEVKQKTEHN